jgi:hypothetical protein
MFEIASKELIKAHLKPRLDQNIELVIVDFNSSKKGRLESVTLSPSEALNTLKKIILDRLKIFAHSIA